MKTTFYRTLTILSMAMAITAIDGFAQKAPVPQGAVPAAAPAPAAAKPTEPLPALSVPPGYKYQVRGRRDPFVNPVPKPVAAKALAPVTRPAGLKGIMISEAQVAAVVVSSDPHMTRAMISAPGGQTVFAKKGDALFDGVVKDIQKDGVVFELKTTDKDGKALVRDVVRKVSP